MSGVSFFGFCLKVHFLGLLLRRWPLRGRKTPVVFMFVFSIFVLVASKGWKPVVTPPFQRNKVNLNHCARFVSLSRAIDETDSPTDVAALVSI